MKYVRTYASRKFLVAVYCLVSATGLTVLGLIDGTTIAAIYSATLLFYGAADVADKHVSKE